MRGETRRKARRCIHRRSIAARIAAKTTGAAAQGAGERPRPRAPRRTPEGAKRGHGSGRLAERTEAGGGELRRTATRRHICICRAVARTRKSPALHREYRYPNRGRTLTGKPAQHKTGQIGSDRVVRIGSNRVRRVESNRVKDGGGFAAGKRAPRRCAPTKMTHIPLPNAARRGGYAGCGFAAHYKPTAARTFSICAAAAARAFFAPSRKMSSSASESFSSSSRLALNGSNIRWYAARSAFFAWP